MPAPVCPDMAGLEWIWQAWNDLNSCREIGMDVGPIPWTAVDRYAIRYGLGADEHDLLWHSVKVLDSVYRDHQETERKKQKHAHNAKRNSSRRNPH